MERISRKSVTKSAPKRWEEQYKNNPSEDKIIITQKLNALVWPFSKQEVDNIIGNESWTRLQCDECGLIVESVVVFSSYLTNYDAGFSVCDSCLLKAIKT